MKQFKALLSILSSFLICLALTLPLQAQETAMVVRIIDGDTLKINYKGKEEGVRLIEPLENTNLQKRIQGGNYK
jgi:endonuclease YncB( thermonuclease family)